MPSSRTARQPTAPSRPRSPSARAPSTARCKRYCPRGFVLDTRSNAVWGMQLRLADQGGLPHRVRERGLRAHHRRPREARLRLDHGAHAADRPSRLRSDAARSRSPRGIRPQQGSARAAAVAGKRRRGRAGSAREDRHHRRAALPATSPRITCTASTRSRCSRRAITWAVTRTRTRSSTKAARVAVDTGLHRLQRPHVPELPGAARRARRRSFRRAR